MINTNQVTVTTAVTPITDAFATSVALTNTGSNMCYIGNAGVTIATGFGLAAGASVTIDVADEQIYGICSTGTTLIHVLETTV